MKEIALYALDIAQNSITARASRLEITLSETPDAITFTIVDNGKGMSPELLAQVSDPFTTTRTTRKMGLGIPLLRMAVEQTGGSLVIDSTEGVGTTVTARFRPGHIDCPPVTHVIGDDSFQLTTEELRAQLGPDISLAEPEIILWIRDYLQEQETFLRENKGMKA